MLLTKLRKYFSKKAELRLFRKSSTEEIFNYIYNNNKWGDSNSRSGKGSNLFVTAGIREALPAMLQQLEVRTLLDIPCGDFHWMKEIQLPVQQYLGADIVKSLVEQNQRQYGNEQRSFVHLDLMRDPLPEVDAIFCRECLVHLSFADITLALENIVASGATYLFTTDFPQLHANKDIVTGKHHSLNFKLSPFNWPEPIMQHVEYDAGKRRGNKCLSVWRIEDIPVPSKPRSS